MQLAFSCQLTKSLASILESIMDGTDNGLLKINKTSTIITAIDSQRQSMHVCTFLASAFAVYECPQEAYTFHIDVVKLFKLLRQEGGSLVLAQRGTELLATVLTNTHKQVVISSRTDKTIYLRGDVIDFRNWNSFLLNSNEAGMLVLELSTGGTFTKIELSPNALPWQGTAECTADPFEGMVSETKKHGKGSPPRC